MGPAELDAGQQARMDQEVQWLVATPQFRTLARWIVASVPDEETSRKDGHLMAEHIAKKLEDRLKILIPNR